MSIYFKMSTHFTKSSAEDFGLCTVNDELAVDPKDGSFWRKLSLHDFGWGKENGYCKLPIPEFQELLDIALNSNDTEDAYGAVSLIIDMYAEELLKYCEILFDKKDNIKLLKKTVKLFDLKSDINRCPTLHKTVKQMEDDYNRWLRISEQAKHY